VAANCLFTEFGYELGSSLEYEEGNNFMWNLLHNDIYIQTILFLEYGQHHTNQTMAGHA